MPVLDLAAYKPVPATLGDANQIANGFQAIVNCINALDNNNFGAGLIFDPLKIMQNAAVRGDALVWNGAAWAPAVGGWTVLPALTYGTTDGHTFTATYAGDLTASVPVGARIKLTNQAATQYFIVTAHVAGTLTLYGGTTYSITNTAITLPSYSREKAPVGFPLNPSLWTEEFTESVSRSQSAPTSGTWYNVGPTSLAIPIGLWRVYYEVVIQVDASGGQADNWGYVTLSTANNSESDASMSTTSRELTTGTWANSLTRERVLALAAKTTHYLNFKVANGAGTTSVGTLGSFVPTFIRAVCAYL